ncbi:helix-turn-helix domain-containing protein [Streptomyces sp. 8K308]|uniref:helix-turn-helix domain-containing protein n=1 Tax=Streptomyces sp. 8K308 TaxID=2530388 RepID=UPI003263BF02
MMCGTGGHRGAADGFRQSGAAGGGPTRSVARGGRRVAGRLPDAFRPDGSSASLHTGRAVGGGAGERRLLSVDSGAAHRPDDQAVGHGTVMVVVPRRGTYIPDQARRQTLIDPGGLVVIPAFRPYEGIVEAGDDSAGNLMCLFPRALVPLPESTIDPLLGTRLPANDGIGALLVDFLTRLDAGMGPDRPGDGARLGVVLLNLFAALLAHHVEAEDDLPLDSRRRALHLQVCSFIERNLGDPGLTPGAIAAAHHISIRTLHRVFEEHGHTIAAHIRAQRLDGARRDLIDLVLAGRPIHAIAVRWGFNGPAAFSRAFRAAYDVTPREYRDQVFPPGRLARSSR